MFQNNIIGSFFLNLGVIFYLVFVASGLTILSQVNSKLSHDKKLSATSFLFSTIIFRCVDMAKMHKKHYPNSKLRIICWFSMIFSILSMACFVYFHEIKS